MSRDKRISDQLPQRPDGRKLNVNTAKDQNPSIGQTKVAAVVTALINKAAK